MNGHKDDDYDDCWLSAENANDPALQLDACDVAIANCSRRLFQAESTEVENLDSILSICQ